MGKWYRALILRNMLKRPMMVEKMDLKDREPSVFLSGEAITDWDGSAWLKVVTKRNEGDPDDVLANVEAIPIYSARLRETLERAGIAGIQYLPVQVFHRDGSPVPGYAIANIQNLVPALDLERSDYSRFSDSLLFEPLTPELGKEISIVRRAVLRSSALEGYDVIRLKEFWLCIYVSERFREVFEGNHLTGYGFSEVELS